MTTTEWIAWACGIAAWFLFWVMMHYRDWMKFYQELWLKESQRAAKEELKHKRATERLAQVSHALKD